MVWEKQGNTALSPGSSLWAYTEFHLSCATLLSTNPELELDLLFWQVTKVFFWELAQDLLCFLWCGKIQVGSKSGKSSLTWPCTHMAHAGYVRLASDQLHTSSGSSASSVWALAQDELICRYVPSKCQAWDSGASDLPCLLSGFAVLSRLLSIKNFLRTVISGKSLKQHAVTHIVVAHNLSTYRKLHFLKESCSQNHPELYWVSADPWKKNTVQSLYLWLYCWSTLFSGKPSEELLNPDPWLYRARKQGCWLGH